MAVSKATLPDWTQDAAVLEAAERKRTLEARSRELERDLREQRVRAYNAERCYEQAMEALRNGRGDTVAAAIARREAEAARVQQEATEQELLDIGEELLPLLEESQRAEAEAMQRAFRELKAVYSKRIQVLAELLPAAVEASEAVGEVYRHILTQFPGAPAGRGHAGFAHCGGLRNHAYFQRGLTRDKLQLWRKWRDEGGMGGAEAVHRKLKAQAEALREFVAGQPQFVD